MRATRGEPARQSGGSEGSAWIRRAPDVPLARQYVDAVRGGVWLILLTVALSLGAAALYLSAAEERYEADVDLLVTPAGNDDPALTGIRLIRTSGDPTRNTQTVARLVTTAEVGARAARILGVTTSGKGLLRDVKASPVADSDIVTIEARASDPERARQLADAVSRAAVETRTAKLHFQLDQLLPRLRARLARTQDEERRQLLSRIGELETLRQRPDPTVAVETPASLPTSPSWPKKGLSLVVAGMTGLLLGLGLVFAMQVFSPRLRREEQLRELYRLPILARVPRFGRFRASEQQAQTSFRALRMALLARDESGRSVLVTGPSASEGKTTTALNLARVLTLGGDDVVLVEADLHRPSLAHKLGLRAREGVLGVITGSTPIGQALVDVSDGTDAHLRVLLADQRGDWLPDILTRATADRLLHELEPYGKWVVLDAPPLGPVLDSLPLAQEADEVILVVRLGRTRLSQLQVLADTLAQHRIRPAGFVVVGASQDRAYPYSA